MQDLALLDLRQPTPSQATPAHLIWMHPLLLLLLRLLLRRLLLHLPLRLLMLLLVSPLCGVVVVVVVMQSPKLVPSLLLVGSPGMQAKQALATTNSPA